MRKVGEEAGEGAERKAGKRGQKGNAGSRQKKGRKGGAGQRENAEEREKSGRMETRKKKEKPGRRSRWRKAGRGKPTELRQGNVGEGGNVEGRIRGARQRRASEGLSRSCREKDGAVVPSARRAEPGAVVFPEALIRSAVLPRGGNVRLRDAAI